MAGDDVVRMMDGQWHKVAALLMQAWGLSEFEITPTMLDSLGRDDMAVVADVRGGKFVIRLMPMDEAQRLKGGPRA